MSISGIASAAVPQYLTMVRDETTSVDNYVKETPTVQREIAAFQKSARSINSAQDLLNDYGSLKVVLGSFGLSSLIDQKAVVKQLLTQDPTSPKSLAKSSGNASWLKLATAFSSWSPSPLSSSDTVNTMSTSYLTSQFETHADDETPGLGTALYFTRSMTSKTSLAGIMSDPKLLKVVETVSGFDPTQFGALDYDQQVRLLQPKVDLKDFSTADGIKRYAERYLATLQIHPDTTAKPATLLSLYGANGENQGILSLFTSSSTSSTGSLFSALT